MVMQNFRGQTTVLENPSNEVVPLPDFFFFVPGLNLNNAVRDANHLLHLLQSASFIS